MRIHQMIEKKKDDTMKSMKRAPYCELCRKKMNFEGHLMFLGMLHLEIERFPERKFTEDEIYIKCQNLMDAVGGKNIHLNLSYALTQLEEREEQEKSVRV